MNALNALVFAALGTAMEVLPKAFPSWFPHVGADSANARALWLDLMGAVQILLGLGFIVWFHAIPTAARIVAMVPAGEAGALALPPARGVIAR